MGGIKNKLSRLSNKVKTLLSFLSLSEGADERSSSGEVKTNKTKGSRLPSFSQPSKMPDGQISNTRKLSHLGLYAEKTIGSLRPTSQSLPLAKGRQMSVAHRWGRITKHLGIACLTLAILSTLVLNIISSYSNSSTRSNAEPVSSSSISTLADNNTTSISLSFSPISTPTSSPDTSNPANVSMQIPDGGEIATGGHTVEVSTGSSVIGYELQLSSNGDETALVNNDASSTSDSGSKPVIPTTTGTVDNPSILADKTYGYTLTDLSSGGAYGGNDDVSNAYSDNPAVNTAIWSGLQPSTSPVTIATVDKLTAGQVNETTNNIYYGVNIQNPVELRAGEYSRQVVYTVVGELMPAPEVDSTAPNVYKIDSIKKIQLVKLDLYALISSGTVYQYRNGGISQFFKLDSRIVDFATYDTNDFSSMVFATGNGQVYSFGKNNYGQLGNGTTVDVDKTSPANITSNFGSTVKRVFAGDYYYAALTEDGRVYMWGYGARGNLGTGNSDNQSTPVDITANFSAIDGSIIDVVLTHDSRSAITFALTDTGHVYGWGCGENGALGTGKDQYEYYPVDITPNFNLNSGETIIQVVADGGNGNRGHGLALTDQGRVFAWGDNRNGALGDGSTTDSYLPKDITGNFELTGDDKIISIGAGINRSYAVSANGVVYRWGDDITVPTVISGDSRFVNMNTGNITFAAGYRPSTFLLDGNNNVYTVVSATGSSSAAGQNITDRFMAKPLTTLTGSNFTNVDNVYIDLNRDGAMQSNEQCTDLTVNSDTELTCNVPTDNNIATGDYTMYIETPYNYTTTTFRYENYGE